MTSAAEDLTRLVESCVVWLEGVHRSGTGVLVAPGLVLTCAHVVGATDSSVTVRWNLAKYTGTVIAAEPARSSEGLWPFPDLAVVNVNEIPQHPCVWLSEHPPTIDARLVVVGHSEVYEDVPRLVTATGSYGGRQAFHGGVLWRFRGDELPRGMSGGPVLDLDSGGVCAFVKTARAPNTDLGGLVAPVTTLRAVGDSVTGQLWHGHDAHHDADRTWTKLRDDLFRQRGRRPFGQLTAGEEVDLLGACALVDVPPAVDLLCDELDLGVVLAEGPADLRGLVYRLADTIGPPGRPHPLLILTDRLARRVGTPTLASDRLREWTARVAQNLGQWDLLQQWRDRHAVVSGSPPTTVIVQLEPSLRDADRYRATVWLYRGRQDNAKVYCADESYPLDRLRSELQEPLRRALAAVSAPAMIEFVVPVELFNEPFEQWRPWPMKSWAQLGLRYPVAVRDLERRHYPTDLWRQRWRRLQERPTSVPHAWLECEDPRTESALDGWLQERHEWAVLGLSTRPDDGATRAALEVGLFAGVPVMIWRRQPCSEHYGSARATLSRGRGVPRPCEGDRFREHVNTSFARTPNLQLPELVRRTRTSAAQDPDHECRDIVLLWDDPDRLPEPIVPLLSPAANP